MPATIGTGGDAGGAADFFDANACMNAKPPDRTTISKAATITIFRRIGTSAGGLELVQCKVFVVAGDPGSGDIPIGPTLVVPLDESVVTVGNELVIGTGDDGTSVVTVGAGLGLIVETDDE